MGGQKEVASQEFSLEGDEVNSIIGPDYHRQLMDDIELLDGACDELDMERVSRGNLSPVFFGSALTNFGVETFLEHFLKMTTSPLPRNTTTGMVDPFSPNFSAFVFKIQANMNKAHRDRIAFMRICSGQIEAGMEVTHVQGGRQDPSLPATADDGAGSKDRRGGICGRYHRCIRSGDFLDR